MILDSDQEGSFFQHPDSNITVILLHGEDEGKTRILAEKLIAATGTAKTDPFSYVELSEEAVKADPALLSDEYAAIGFGSGRRILRLRLSQDRVPAAIVSFLKELDIKSLDGALPLLILEAGTLTPKADLRAIAEKSANMAAIACHADHPRSLRHRIDSVLKVNGLEIAPDAVEAMLEICGENYASTDQELEKLILFKLHDTNRTITREEVTNSVTGGKTSTATDIAEAILSGNNAALDRHLNKAAAQNESPISILRAMAWHLERPAGYGTGNRRAAAPEAARNRQRLLFWSEKMLKQTGIPQWPFFRHALSQLISEPPRRGNRP